MDRFLYDNDLQHERVKCNFKLCVIFPGLKILRYAWLCDLLKIISTANYNINPFVLTVTFYSARKYQKTGRFSDVFRGYRNVTLETN